VPKNKSKVKGHRKPHIINTVQPETVAEMMKPVDPAEVVNEEHVVAVIPRSTWQKICDFMGW
jgi:1,4-dihydroxy-2-naphthoyl-CoA synthase